jgi:hypothetical protein
MNESGVMTDDQLNQYNQMISWLTGLSYGDILMFIAASKIQSL